MFKAKKKKRSKFTKASTPEGIKRQRAAIKAYYAKKRGNKNPFKSGKPKRKNVFKKNKVSPFLLDMHKLYREQDLGALEWNGKLYDTNFKDGPHEITKEDLIQLREEYDSNGNLSDYEVADKYVRHMRRKFGVFDRETDEWLGLGTDVH
ncbi:MAG: hypothetical protein IJ309_02370 [Clostridia bacterium]|nr:hypothetical protein [Clostridia bacterium]